MNKSSSSLIALVVLIQLAISPARATALIHTIGDRLQQVGTQLSDAEQQRTLSVEKLQALRKEKFNISAAEAKAMSENGGSLSYADIEHFEDELNTLSTKITKDTQR